MKSLNTIHVFIAAFLSSAMFWAGSANANLGYDSGLYWGSGLSRIVLKGVPGNPDFLVPMISANIESGDNLMYQFRFAYGGRGDTFADLDRSIGLYAKYHLWSDGFVRPFAMVGYTSTKYTNNTFFSQSSGTTIGLSAGIGLKFATSEVMHYAVEILGLNRENDHINTAVTAKVYYSF